MKGSAYLIQFSYFCLSIHHKNKKYSQQHWLTILTIKQNDT